MVLGSSPVAVTELVHKLSVNKRENLINVIKWFKNINGTKLYKFLQFYRKSFYQSVKETLEPDTIQFPKEHVSITRKDLEVILTTESLG